MQQHKQEDAYLFELEVPGRIEHLISFIVQEDEGDDSPEDLEVPFKLDKQLQGHVRNLQDENHQSLQE